MYLSGGDLPLGNHILPAPYYFSASAFRAAEQMLDLPQFVHGAISHAGVFFISGYLIRRYIDSVPWTTCVEKRIWSIARVLVLWGVVQWLALVALNNWLAPQRDLSHAANAAYADSITGFTHGMLTASTSLWYLYALIVYFVLCKIFSRWAAPLLALFVVLSVAINFVPTPWWGMNSVIRNLPRTASVHGLAQR